MENSLNPKPAGPTDRPKLNLLALPNQTTILFWLIVTVLLGTLFAGSIGPSPVLIWPLASALFLLPLRAFLARPERNFARYHLKPCEERSNLPGYALLQRELETYAVKIGLRRTPQLVVSSKYKGLKPSIFGTFRHWYLAVGDSEAQTLQATLENPETAPTTQALLLHELYHFKTGDYWQLGYAGELLPLTFKVMTWAAAFFFGFGTLLLIAKPDLMQLNFSEMVAQRDAPLEVRELLLQLLPSEAAMEAVRQKAAGINFRRVLTFVVGTTWPFLVMGFVGWWVYWPRLWRMREFYADAGVVQTQKEILPLRSALVGVPLANLRRSPSTTFSETKAQTSQRKNCWKRILSWQRTLWDTLGSRWLTLRDKVSESWQNEKPPLYPPRRRGGGRQIFSRLAYHHRTSNGIRPRCHPPNEGCQPSQPSFPQLEKHRFPCWQFDTHP